MIPGSNKVKLNWERKWFRRFISKNFIIPPPSYVKHYDPLLSLPSSRHYECSLKKLVGSACIKFFKIINKRTSAYSKNKSSNIIVLYKMYKNTLLVT